MIQGLRAAWTRRAAFAVWRELGCPVQYHPDGLQGYELLGRPVPADPLAPLRGQWYILRLAVGRAARHIVHSTSRAVQRECFDLRVLWGALTRPGLVWVTAEMEAGLADEIADIHLVSVQPGWVDEWFGQRRVDRAPSLTRRLTTWLWRNHPSHQW